eukprot:7366565-Prymnesium_polylepis.5
MGTTQPTRPAKAGTASPVSWLLRKEDRGLSDKQNLQRVHVCAREPKPGRERPENSSKQNLLRQGNETQFTKN